MTSDDAVIRKLDRIVDLIMDVRERVVALEKTTVTHHDLRDTRRWLIGFGVSAAVLAASVVPLLFS